MKDGYSLHEQNGMVHAHVRGTDEKDIFHRGLLALASIMRPDVSPEMNETVQVPVRLIADNQKELFEKFLAHVVFESDMHNAVFSGMNLVRLTKNEIECELIGKEVDHIEEEVAHLAVAHPGIYHIDGQHALDYTVDLL